MIDLQPRRCLTWLHKVWPLYDNDVEERALRFGEESLELQQAVGVTREQAHRLVDQVFDKPMGDPAQELGGTMVTLASLCAVAGWNADAAFEQEFERCERPEIIERIQKKHATKAVVSSSIR